MASRKERREQHSAAGNSWWMWNVLAPLGILLLGVTAILVFGKKTAPTKPLPDQSLGARIARLPAVQTMPAHSLDAVGGVLGLDVDGVVVPYREVQVATEVAGRIIYKDAACEVGTYVEQGQLLFRIDPTDYESEVARLTKQKEQEYQAIRELDQEMVNSRRLIEIAEQEIELQEREIERLRSLPAGFTSQSELDQSERARLQAVNSRLTLENQLDLMRQRRARLESAEELANIQLELAKTNLQRTEIRSPISGVIFREDAELNSFVQRGEVIITIEDTSKAEVVINLRTDQLYWVLDQERKSPGAPPASSGSVQNNYDLPTTDAVIRYHVAGREEEVYQWRGRLERYDGIGFDSSSRTVPVRVMVDNPRRFQAVENTASDPNERADAMAETGAGSSPPAWTTGPTALVRGMFVQVELRVHPKRQLVVIPEVALRPGSRAWKFVADASVIPPPVSPPTAEGAEPGEVVVAAVSTEVAESNDTDTATAPDSSAVVDPDQWLAGRLDVLERVRPIEAVELEPADAAGEAGTGDTIRCWICEVGAGALEPGDQLIVSPLPSFEGRGSDAVRVKKNAEDPATVTASDTASR